MAKVIRTMYGDRTPGPKLKCSKTMAQQQFKDECDINNIIARYETTGSWSNNMRPAIRQPMYGDYSEIPDFQEAQNIIIEGREAFESLPARIRKRFNNNPADLLQFLSNPANRDECIELGLIPPDMPEPERKPGKIEQKADEMIEQEAV